MLHSWLLFLYKVPHEPSSHRVYVWRKLKRLGAVLLHDSAWVMPLTPRSQEQFQLLAIEIAGLGGDSLLWEARLVPGAHDEALDRVLLAHMSLPADETPVEVE